MAYTERTKSRHIFDKLASRITQNISKFKQPSFQSIELPDKFILFPCQLPHDETIRYHSDVSVEKALSAVILAIKENQSCSLIIKGHPANRCHEKFIRYLSSLQGKLA